MYRDLVPASSVLVTARRVLMFRPMPPKYKHWCYPSSIIGCGLDTYSLDVEEHAFLRSEVTCPTCLAQLRADKEICAACRLGAPEIIPVSLAPPHVCDPELS